MKPQSVCRKQNGKSWRIIFDIFNQRKFTKWQLTFYKPSLESSLLALIGQSFKHENKRRMNMWLMLKPIQKPSSFDNLPWGFPDSLMVKESACQCRRHRFSPWVGKIPWRSKWQPTVVFSPGKCHGQRSLACYNPWGHKSQTQFSD